MMFKTAMRALALACALPLVLSANYLINDYLISPKAGAQIEIMGKELAQKTGINAYVVATTQKIPRKTNLYEYIKHYTNKFNKPYAVIFFAPNSHRIGVLGSSEDINKMFDTDEVKQYAIDIIGTEDSNSVQSRYDVGIVQAYSELADELAKAKGVEMSTTIKDQSHWIVASIRWIVLLGSLIIIWIYFAKPFFKRMRNGKK